MAWLNESSVIQRPMEGSVAEADAVISVMKTSFAIVQHVFGCASSADGTRPVYIARLSFLFVLTLGVNDLLATSYINFTRFLVFPTSDVVAKYLSDLYSLPDYQDAEPDQFLRQSRTDEGPRIRTF